MDQARKSYGDPLIGATIAGRYRIEARVGSGAMGSVYRAEQAGLGRKVALKILNRDRVAGGDTVQRFRREAKALSALHHPNTVRVFDFGSTEDGMLFLAMELLEGEPLTDRILRETPLPAEEAVAITQQVLRSIGEAHAHGIVHRDLKPDNVFLARVQSEPAPIVKVLDFGIAKAIEGDRKIDQFETLDGTVFGTPRYMSPEQAGGRPLDLRSDLYAVGIMLYELLSGRPPFVDNDAVVVMARHIRETPAPVSEVSQGRPFPLCLDRVVNRALAKSPADRFQSADEFDAALARCLPAIRRLARLTDGAGWSRWRRASPAIKWASVAGACIALAASGLWWSNARHDARTAAQFAAAMSRQRSAQARKHAAAARPAASVVSLQSAPADAEVLQGDSKLGVTPLDVRVNPGSTLTLLLRKKGFAEHTLELHADDGERVVMLTPLDRRRHPSQSWRRNHESRPSRSSHERTRAAETSKTEAPATSQSRPPSPYEKF